MIRAKKKFGQNFLTDESIKRQIIQAIPNDLERIVEIGPGLGDLTQKLVQLSGKIECFEIDSELYEILLDKFASEILEQKLKITNADALESWDEISRQDYFLVANLPYYVATNMILKALSDSRCKGLVVMIQKEVALKFSAQPGDSEFSALAILAGVRGDVELLFDVPATAFNPEPKVVSAVIRIIKDRNLVDDFELSEFERFLRSAFVAPRKTLLKNLACFCSKSIVESFLAKHNLPLTTRPHELCVALYLKLFKEAKNERREYTNSR
ncbi:16S rRNA (adenine(1518)-N(6)/adenine(1519)-N(6))-dimethyltransferase RsmA [Campylobacter devanensis]|uniref:16S rRNA (adenine(1518)-N(6)/adenine(1519)-N(6))- dimethyltransferase RsmA n=1 Tax=Campylobacter devanensis TaxID=3161138 RepID=UPI000A358447|nr:16S rRNA (adenine(1518)-N(6)/adenine(1519)-N(6))-dimethyltransferase RsmA [Campylobacter sp. P0106]